jgi:uncharacterized damage-inducible protein DinB
MIPVETLRELYDYDSWARDRQLKACAALSPEQFLRPMGSSFSSLRDTLAHLLAAQWIWHERWRGRSWRTMPGVAEGLPLEEMRRRWNEQFPTPGSLAERWRPLERDIHGFLMGLSDQDLAREIRYLNVLGEAWSYPLWRVMIHLVNHQTYHRGQVTTLLRQLGATAPATDFLVAHDEGFRH